MQAVKTVDDGTLDFVFIDADHSYEGAKQDIAAWYPKVKKGGWIGGHDYGRANKNRPWGVKRAVDKFVKEYGLTLKQGHHFTWFVRLPAG